MTKQKRIIVLCMVLALAAVLIYFACGWSSIFLHSERAASVLTGRYEKELETVASYLCAVEHDSIIIKKRDADSMLMLLIVDPLDGQTKNMDVPIEEKEVQKAANKLFASGCNKITKSGDTVEFLFWTQLMDFGAGLVWHENTETLPDVQFLTRLDALETDGWYYYEADFNEYRRGKRVQ